MNRTYEGSVALAAGQVGTIEITPQDPDSTFYGTKISAVPRGSQFDVLDILVGTESQMSPGSLDLSMLREIKVSCDFPKMIVFRVHNTGATPGQLTITVEGDTDEPYIGQAEVITIS